MSEEGGRSEPTARMGSVGLHACRHRGPHTIPPAPDPLGRHDPTAPPWHGSAEQSPLLKHHVLVVKLAGTFQAVPFGVGLVYF